LGEDLQKPIESASEHILAARSIL